MNKQEFTDIYEYCYYGWSNFLGEAQTDLEFALGAQFTDKEAKRAEQLNRSLYPFNKMLRQIRLLHGYEIRNRHILKIGPIGGTEDDAACRQHTGIVMNAMSVEDGYDILSDAFLWGSLVTGSNLMEIYRDQNGSLKFGRWGYNQFLLDPMMTRRDLGDCGTILTGSWIKEDKLNILLPSDSDKTAKIPKISASSRWPLLPYKPTKAEDVRLYEQWWSKKSEYQKMVIDRANGVEISYKDFIKEVMLGQKRRGDWLIDNFRLPNGVPALSKYEKPRDKVYLKVYVDEELVWEGENPLGIDDYNFVWLGGDFVPECNRDALKLQSFARSIREPQRARNRRLNQILDMIDSQLQAWRIAREGSLVKREMAYDSGNKVVWIKKDAPGGLEEHFIQKNPPDIPAGLFNILELLDKEETQIGGLNEEILGSDNKDIPGILHSYRTGQALTGQQGLFSAFRQAKRSLGRKMVKTIQKNYNKIKIRRILNEDPAPNFYEPDFTKFDCNPVEGVMTDSQRHLYYLQLDELRSKYPDAATIIPVSALIDAAPIQYKEELYNAIKQAEQKQQQEMQVAMADKERINRLMEAQAAEDIAQAQENRSGAFLDKVKAMAEINKMKTESVFNIVDRLIKIEQMLGMRSQI